MRASKGIAMNDILIIILIVLVLFDIIYSTIQGKKLTREIEETEIRVKIYLNEVSKDRYDLEDIIRDDLPRID